MIELFAWNLPSFATPIQIDKRFKEVLPGCDVDVLSPKKGQRYHRGCARIECSVYSGEKELDLGFKYPVFVKLWVPVMPKSRKKKTFVNVLNDEISEEKSIGSDETSSCFVCFGDSFNIVDPVIVTYGGFDILPDLTCREAACDLKMCSLGHCDLAACIPRATPLENS